MLKDRKPLVKVSEGCLTIDVGDFVILFLYCERTSASCTWLVFKVWWFSVTLDCSLSTHWLKKNWRWGVAQSNQTGIRRFRFTVLGSKLRNLTRKYHTQHLFASCKRFARCLRTNAKFEPGSVKRNFCRSIWTVCTTCAISLLPVNIKVKKLVRSRVNIRKQRKINRNW